MKKVLTTLTIAILISLTSIAAMAKNPEPLRIAHTGPSADYEDDKAAADSDKPKVKTSIPIANSEFSDADSVSTQKVPIAPFLIVVVVAGAGGLVLGALYYKLAQISLSKPNTDELVNGSDQNVDENMESEMTSDDPMIGRS